MKIKKSKIDPRIDSIRVHYVDKTHCVTVIVRPLSSLGIRVHF